MRKALTATALLAATALLTMAGPPAAAAETSPAADSQAASSVPAGHPSTLASHRNRPQVVTHYVDINSAGRKELKTLPGIGDAEADRIVANRPYLTKTELVTKNVLPTGPYLALKNRVVAMQKQPPKAKTHG